MQTIVKTKVVYGWLPRVAAHARWPLKSLDV